MSVPFMHYRAVALTATVSLILLAVASVPAVAQTATPFCKRDFSQLAARQADVMQLQATGGLVYLLEQPGAQAPFSCAAFYLEQGLDVNALSPDNELTALHYAIKANQPEMVQFVISHGADLHIKAGQHDLEPIAYAYYLAINHPQGNRNQIIRIINNALNRSDGLTKK